MRKLFALVLCLAMLCVLGGCMEKGEISVLYGDCATIALSKDYEMLTWETSNDDIAEVTAGKVTGVGPGQAIITAYSDSKAVAEFVVDVNIIEIKELFLQTSELALEIDEETTLGYSLFPTDASTYGIEYTSINPEIAKVDQDGKITGVAAGKTHIVVSTKSGMTKSCEVTVLEPSAIEKLNEHELKFYQFLTNTMLPNFYNAPAARVNALFMIKTDSSEVESVLESTGIYTVEMQGTNRLGGTLKKFYGVMLSIPFYNESKEGFSPYSSDSWMPVPEDVMNVSKINEALEEYWTGKGM